MNEMIQPNDKLKKNMLMFLILAEAFIGLLLLNNFLHSYNLVTSLTLIFVVIVGVVIFDLYMWSRLSKEYLMIGYTYLEWNGNRFEWDVIEEIRLRREKEKPMFLIIKHEGEYIKIPLRLFQDQVENILNLIKGLELEITES